MNGVLSIDDEDNDHIVHNDDENNTSQSAEPLLPHYVYVLADPNDKLVFYVGMGQGTRVLSHWTEVKRSLQSGTDMLHPKQLRMKAIQDQGREPVQAIVARFETREEAFAVESILINWMYGYDDLTNQNRGHNSNWIREKGNWNPKVRLELEKRESVRDGVFSSKKIEGLAATGAFDLLAQAISALQVANFHVREFDNSDDRPYHPGESNGWLGFIVEIEGIDFIVSFSKTKILSICLGTTQATRNSSELIVAVGWNLDGPKNLTVRGVGRYRSFLDRTGTARGYMKFSTVDDIVKEFHLLQKELRAGQTALAGRLI